MKNYIWHSYYTHGTIGQRVTLSKYDGKKENKKEENCMYRKHKTMVNKQIIHWTNMIKISEGEWNFCGYKSNYIEP